MVNAVKKCRGVIIKLPAHWYRGIPDRLLLLPGARIFFVELKRKGKSARKNQRRWVLLLRHLGFTAGIVSGSGPLNKFIQTHLTPDKIPP